MTLRLEDASVASTKCRYEAQIPCLGEKGRPIVKFSTVHNNGSGLNCCQERVSAPMKALDGTLHGQTGIVLLSTVFMISGYY